MVNKSISSEISKTGYLDEDRLRQLAVELARDIHAPDVILKHLNLTEEDYEAIKETRAFKNMYNLAVTEWNAAGNTFKRTKLKAAAMTEEVLPMFFADIAERKEGLNARVGLLNTLAKIGGLGNPEPPLPGGGNHQFFKLEIHLQGRQSPIIIEPEPLTVGSYGARESEWETSEQANEKGQGTGQDDGEQLRESPLAANDPYDEF